MITTIGEWIKFRRKFLDLTQDQLAQKVGCSSAAIKKIESNDRRPSRQVAALLAGQLRLSYDQGEIFVRVARGELPLDRLHAPRELATVLEGQPAQPSPAAAVMSIPHPSTPLLGRERELAEITRLIQDPHCRLLTITGIGGAGKTRLAIEAALQLRPVFADGVYFVALAGLDSPALLIPAIAGALGLTFSGPYDKKLQLIHSLHGRQILLVLDNLEHLLEGAGLFCDLLQFAPQVKLLATSLEQLHLRGEWVFEVRGLPVARVSQAEVIESSSASQLFLQRARQFQASLRLDRQEYEAIGRVCQLVQGLPLAIELAAMWTRTLTCVEIAQEIERGLDFLAVNSRAVAARDMAPRHRSLQAVFDHSWELLNDDEKRVMVRLSVFRGGFRREAAEQIAGAKIHILSALIDKSLIVRAGSGRYDIHQLIRQYLAGRLAEDPDEERDARDRHSRYYLNLLRAREAGLRSRSQKDTLAELDEDFDNVRLAWNTAVEHGLFDLLEEAAGARRLLEEGVELRPVPIQQAGHARPGEKANGRQHRGTGT